MSAALSLFSIPSGESFVDALARGILTETPDPLSLSKTLVLTPTRRGRRALAEAFLRAGDGRAMLLPKIGTLGDIEDDFLESGEEGEEDLDLPPAIPPLRRQLLLASLVMKLGAGRGGEAPTPEQAAALAGSLAGLLDEAHIAGADFANLADLVPEELAAHWRVTLDFLTIVTSHWPAILAEQGWMDPAERRLRLMERRAAQWAKSPPPYPVIAAGSTGSMPATADLLRVIAGAPQGKVVLPGLDFYLDDDSWSDLPPTHPQYHMARLLKRMEVDRGAVRLWPGAKEGPRAPLISEALRPDGVSAKWRGGENGDMGAFLEGLSRVDCQTPAEEAGIIALLMRRTLETPGRRAALVTPDRALARRVAAELERFDIEIDDSAGMPLVSTLIGSWLLLLAEMAARDFAPHDFLAAMKHAFAAGGEHPAAFGEKLRRLEIIALRGPRPKGGIAGLQAVLAASEGVGEEEKNILSAWLLRLEAQGGAFFDLFSKDAASLADLAQAHIACAEALATTEGESGADRLWRGDAGEEAARFLSQLLEAAPAAGEINPAHYPGLLRTLLSGAVARPKWGRHPRLFIWGPLEARMQQCDLLLLGGLNEGVWPSDAKADPWMSRPMRDRFGLLSPEQRIGLAAHDFEQAAQAPNVVLTRSVRADGSPTVPSRWLLRLDAALAARSIFHAWENGDWAQWRRLLDQPEKYLQPQPPAPRPPLYARPRQLSATMIETWMRDPYAIYARHILKLKALDPIDADPAASDFGTMVHEVLNAFSRRFSKGPLPEDAREILQDLGRRAFQGLSVRPALVPLWRPRFAAMLEWFIEKERERRALLSQSWSEAKGQIAIDAPYGPFILTAIADRIDLLKEGGLAILDYKTGVLPAAKAVVAGFSPQLPIEAAIAEAGGFQTPPGQKVVEMTYWKLGGVKGGEERPALPKDADPKEAAAAALEGVKNLVAAFDDENTAYAARPHPDYLPRYSDYGHLARVREWASQEGGDEE